MMAESAKNEEEKGKFLKQALDISKFSTQLGAQTYPEALNWVYYDASKLTCEYD